MLNIFRRRDTIIRIFVGCILLLVCVTMVITLIPGITGTTGDPLAIGVVAEVGGEEITAWDLQQNVLQTVRANSIPSDMMWLYTPQVLEQMVMEKVTAQEAARMGLNVTSAEMAERLRQDPNLFPGGTFVGQQQYEDLVLQRFGIGIPQFEERFRRALLVEKLRSLVTDPLTVTEEEIRKKFQEDNEKVVLDYVFLDPAEFKKELKPADSELQAYFEKNKDRYTIPETRSAKILLVETEKVRQATSVSDDDVKKTYDSNQDNFRVEERVQASHILLKAPENDAAALERAKTKAAEIVKKLQEGADFAQLAKENSEDTGSAPQGGDLGWIVRKQTVPEFEKAAFTLAPGTVSDPVQTVYGIHILKVQAHEAARLKPLEEVKSELQSALLDEKAQAALAREADEASGELRRSPDKIEELAGKYHAVVLTPPPFSQDDLVPGVGQSPPFQQEVFGLEKGRVGQPIQVASGYAIPLLVEVHPAHPGEFAEAKDRVRDEFLDERAKDQALTKANELAGLFHEQTTKDIKKAAQSLKLAVKSSEPLNRAGSIPGVGAMGQFGLRAFTLSEGETAGPIAVGGGQIVYQVASKQPAKEEELPAQKETVRDSLLNQKRQLAFIIFQENLKSRMEASGDLVIHNDVVARMATTTLP